VRRALGPDGTGSMASSAAYSWLWESCTIQRLDSPTATVAVPNDGQGDGDGDCRLPPLRRSPLHAKTTRPVRTQKEALPLHCCQR